MFRVRCRHRAIFHQQVLLLCPKISEPMRFGTFCFFSQFGSKSGWSWPPGPGQVILISLAAAPYGSLFHGRDWKPILRPGSVLNYGRFQGSGSLKYMLQFHPHQAALMFRATPNNMVILDPSLVIVCRYNFLSISGEWEGVIYEVEFRHPVPPSDYSPLPQS